MRKIEKAMCEAVKTRKNWQSGNTQVSVYNDMYGYAHIGVRLHGNLIWKRNEAEDTTEFTLAGWNTVTTRSRLRALGVNVSGQITPKLDGVEIDDHRWYEAK